MDMMNYQQYGPMMQQPMGGAMPGVMTPNMAMGNPYNFQGYGYQQAPAPQTQNALTQEELKILLAARPGNDIDLNITQEEFYRSMCNHKNNGTDCVQQVTDGSGDVYCPICQEKWNPKPATEEEVQEAIDFIGDQFQNVKWIGNLPTEVIREYFTFFPLLKKFPKIHKVASNNFNKYNNSGQYYNMADANIYSQYNSVMNGGFYAQQPQYGYQMMPQQQGPGYYGMQQPMPMAQPATSMNPMDINNNPQMAGQQMMPQQPWMQQQAAPQPYQPAPQQGFVQGAPVAQQSPVAYQPNFGTVQPQAQQPATQPTNPVAPQTEKKEETVTI